MGQINSKNIILIDSFFYNGLNAQIGIQILA